jgi:hypothetical protein
MEEKPSDLVQGTLDMLILKTLALEPMHGYGIAVRLEQMSKGVFRLNAGSLSLVSRQEMSNPRPRLKNRTWGTLHAVLIYDGTETSVAL